jgi:hypothetical protein
MSLLAAAIVCPFVVDRFIISALVAGVVVEVRSNVVLFAALRATSNIARVVCPKDIVAVRGVTPKLHPLVLTDSSDVFESLRRAVHEPRVVTPHLVVVPGDFRLPIRHAPFELGLCGRVFTGNLLRRIPHLRGDRIRILVPRQLRRRTILEDAESDDTETRNVFFD